MTIADEQKLDLLEDMWLRLGVSERHALRPIYEDIRQRLQSKPSDAQVRDALQEIANLPPIMSAPYQLKNMYGEVDGEIEVVSSEKIAIGEPTYHKSKAIALAALSALPPADKQAAPQVDLDRRLTPLV